MKELLEVIVLAGITVSLGILLPVELLMEGRWGLAMLLVLVTWEYIGGRLNDNDR